MSTRTRWTLYGGLFGAIPGLIAVMLVVAFAGCPDSPGEPGMVCYDLKQLLLRITGMTVVVGAIIGSLVGMTLGSRRSPSQRGSTRKSR